MDLKITRNDEAKEYQAEFERRKIYIEFIAAKGRIYLVHTEVPKGLEGKGLGSAIVKGTLELIEANGDALFPLCPFVASYIRRHPEWKRILAPGVNV